MAFHFKTALKNAPDSVGARNAMGVGVNSLAVELQERTRRFASAVIAFCDRLPKDPATKTIVEQLLDSAGSTDSNYRATCRARSPDEFIAKIGVAAEEADESKGWLQLLVASNLTPLIFNLQSSVFKVIGGLILAACRR
jgi:four helix bundle protein